MSQPIATSAAVPNANSSAPSSAATSRSRPVCRPPSVRSATRSRRSLRSSDLVDLGEAELPRRADVLDRRQRRRAGPAGVAGQVDVRGAGLGDARGDRPDAALATSLTPIRAPRVDRPQVGDELGEVLDRVDVVVRRRADVALPGLAAAERGDVGRRLAAGQLAALAGLRALGDLDLELVGAGEVRGGHAEPGRRDLLDPGVVGAAVRRPARTRPGPRRPRRCSRRRRPAGSRSSAPGGPRGLSAPTLIADTTKRRTIDAARPRPRRAGSASRARRTRARRAARRGRPAVGRGPSR